MENKITKDGFIMYSSHWPGLSIFTDEEMGRLMKSVFKYYLYGTVPEYEEKSLAIMFNIIREKMDKDKAKYVNKCNKNKEYRQMRDTESADNKDFRHNYNPYFTGKEKDMDKEREKEKDNNRDIINTGYDIKLFVKDFSDIRGKKFRCTHYLRNQFRKRIDEGYTAQMILDTLRSAMQEDFHISEGFERLTPLFILKRETLELYTVLKRKNREDPIPMQNLAPGNDEWIKDGRRFYRFMDEIIPVPMDAPPRRGKEYVYEYETDKWVLPSNF